MTRVEALERVAEAARRWRWGRWEVSHPSEWENMCESLARAVADLDAIPPATEPPPATVTLTLWRNGYMYELVDATAPNTPPGWTRLGTVTLEVKP